MKDRSQLGVARAEHAPKGLIPLPVEPRRRRLRYEVVGLGFLGLGVLLLANLHTPSGLLGYWLGQVPLLPVRHWSAPARSPDRSWCWAW